LIERATPLRQPLISGWDAVRQPEAGKITVLRTSIWTSVPQIPLDLTSLLYGLAGLLLGGPLGHALRESPATAVRRIRWQNTVGHNLVQYDLTIEAFVYTEPRLFSARARR
jgi:hypothetical protein